MKWLTDIKKATNIAHYWHIEVFLLVPWGIYITYKLIQVVNYLEIIAK